MSFALWFILAGLCLAISFVVFRLPQGVHDGRNMRLVSAETGLPQPEGHGGQN